MAWRWCISIIALGVLPWYGLWFVPEISSGKLPKKLQTQNHRNQSWLDSMNLMWEENGSLWFKACIGFLKHILLVLDFPVSQMQCWLPITQTCTFFPEHGPGAASYGNSWDVSPPQTVLCWSLPMQLYNSAVSRQTAVVL